MGNNMDIKTIRVIILSCVFSAGAAMAADTLYDNRFKEWQQDAEKGKARAQYKLGNAYLRGNEVEINVDEAIRWFEAAAKQGHAKSEYKLGYLYYTGKGVKRNYRRSYDWLSKAANRGYAPAQYYLAKLYSNGRGTRKDYGKAVYWLEKAAADNYTPAKRELSDVRAALREEERERERARAAAAKPKPKAVAKAKPAPKKVAAAKPAPKPTPKKAVTGNTPEATKAKLLGSLWSKNGEPALNMPSAVNNCVEKGTKIVCLSEKMERSTTLAQVVYQVETTFVKFKKDGEFLASYRVNNVFVLPEDPDDPSPNPEDVPPYGWQSPTLIKCQINGSKMECVNDNFKKENFVASK